jgi:hypothetical protein
MTTICESALQETYPSAHPASRKARGGQSDIAPYWSRRLWINWCGLGVASGLFVKLIGYLTMLEAYFLITLPLRAQAVFNAAVARGVAPFTLLWIGWVVGAAVADIVNDTPFSFAARGFSRAFFLGFLCLCLLPLWASAPRSYEAFLAGIPAAHVIGLKYFRSGTYTTLDGEIDASTLGWENWTNYFIASIVVYVIASHWRRRPWFCIAVAGVSGAVNLIMGSRSAGATQLLAAVVMPFFVKPSRSKEFAWRKIVRRLGIGRIFAIVLAAMIATIAVSGTYGYLATSGTLGEKAKQKYEKQKNAKGGMLVGGRSEFFIGLAAALDKPLLGHGSWPEDTVGYADKASARFGVEIVEDRAHDKRLRKFIKVHSAIMSAWVDHGILGALFWMYLLVFVVRNVPRSVTYMPEYTGVIVFNSVAFLWAFFFSPIQQRSYNAIVFVPLLIIQMRHVRAAIGRPSPAQAVALRQHVG